MPRAIWKGQISFGLVTIPVGLYSAESASDGVSFHLYDKRDNSRIRNERTNEKTGQKVSSDDIVRGFELENGQFVAFSNEDLNEIETRANQTIEIEEFVPVQNIGRRFFDKPYYLAPERRGEKGYLILREALADSSNAGIAKVVIRTREYLSALIPEGDALYLFLLRYAHELRTPDVNLIPARKPSELNVSEKELVIAKQLIEAMTSDWDPEKYQDEYRERLFEWVDQRSKSKSLRRVEPTSSPEEKVIDIMELLKASMKKAKATGDSEKRSRRKSS